MELVRIFLSLAASRKSHIHLVDIKTAYLNGILDEEIYAVVPDGMKSHASGNRFMRLLRAIYGLKQSGRIWALLLHRVEGTARKSCMGGMCLVLKLPHAR
jgi:hypothetical protein